MTKTREEMSKIYTTIAGVCAFAAIGAMLAFGPTKFTGAISTPMAQLRAEEKVRDGMRNPEGVKFRNVVVTESQYMPLTTVCGEYNAENGFGAYTGYSRFIYTHHTVDGNDREVLSIEPTGPEETEQTRKLFDSVWRISCK
jgi:hypothetical protein